MPKAILETIMGYLISAFLQDPIFRYEGVSPEDTVGAISLEKIIDLHCNKAKIGLNLHTLFRDNLVYGFGVVGPRWNKTYGKKIVPKVNKRIFGLDTISKQTVDSLIYEGNELVNIDPYLCLPDPNVSIAEVQKGEFFGWVEHTNYLDLLNEEKHSSGNLFNVRYLKEFKSRKTSIYAIDNSGRDKKTGLSNSPDNPNTTKPLDKIHMFKKIIPKEMGLGKSEYPEKWLFSVAADSILIEARPLGLVHDLFPITVAASDFDGYSRNPVSRLESLYGLQHTLDWMFNAHVANVRKVINDTLIVDPYLINVPDLETPRAGGIVRMRRPAWGRGVKDSVMQLAVTDVTRGHIADTGIIRDAMDRVGATDGWTMGSLRQGGPERLTGKEFEGTKQGAFTRLERMARIIGLQDMQDIGYMFAHHTQQFMSQSTYLNTNGRWEETLLMEFQQDNQKWNWNGKIDSNSRYKVTPYDLLVDYDVKVRDGSVPGSNYSSVWTKMFEILAVNPELQETFDLKRIFMHIARNNGAKNAQEFIRVKMASNEHVSEQAQAGNILPIDQIIGGG